MKRLILPLLIVLMVILIILNTKPPSTRNEEQSPHHPQEVNAAVALQLRYIPEPDQLQNTPLDRNQLSEMALLLDAPDLPDSEAMPAIHSLLTSLRIVANGNRYPAGLNVEITNALLGKNARKVGYLPVDCPRINQNGELVDQYGSPYWFHSPRQGILYITSAGPDRILHTDDDIVFH